MELIADWLGKALHQSAQKDLLQRIALTDPLTGLPNRRAAEERLQKEGARTPRDGIGFALALVDLDHFKMVNDRYGHAVGDEMLKAVARRFESGMREGDWVARWGGEEFLFVLHGSTVEEAAGVMERLAGLSRATPIQTSVGLAAKGCHEPGDTLSTTPLRVSWRGRAGLLSGKSDRSENSGERLCVLSCRLAVSCLDRLGEL